MYLFLISEWTGERQRKCRAWTIKEKTREAGKSMLEEVKKRLASVKACKKTSD